MRGSPRVCFSLGLAPLLCCLVDLAFRSSIGGSLLLRLWGMIAEGFGLMDLIPCF
jgi:hypothetical protein